MAGLKKNFWLAKIKTVVVPEKNRRDVEEMEKEIYQGMDIVYAYTMDDVLKTALVHMPQKPEEDTQTVASQETECE